LGGATASIRTLEEERPTRRRVLACRTRGRSGPLMKPAVVGLPPVQEGGMLLEVVVARPLRSRRRASPSPPQGRRLMLLLLDRLLKLLRS
jgi:hypothetical protein